MSCVKAANRIEYYTARPNAHRPADGVKAARGSATAREQIVPVCSWSLIRHHLTAFVIVCRGRWPKTTPKRADRLRLAPLRRPFHHLSSEFPSCKLLPVLLSFLSFNRTRRFGLRPERVSVQSRCGLCDCNSIWNYLV